MIDRRTIVTATLAAIATPVVTRRAMAEAAMSRITAYAFSFPALEKGDIRLADFAGQPLVIVNTASLCGFTPQYAGLQQLWTEFQRSRADDRRRSLQRFRRSGTRRRQRHRSRPRSINTGLPFRSPPRPW